jgi:hypothetical protein
MSARLHPFHLHVHILELTAATIHDQQRHAPRAIGLALQFLAHIEASPVDHADLVSADIDDHVVAFETDAISRRSANDIRDADADVRIVAGQSQDPLAFIERTGTTARRRLIRREAAITVVIATAGSIAFSTAIVVSIVIGRSAFVLIDRLHGLWIGADDGETQCGRCNKRECQSEQNAMTHDESP